MTVSSQDISPRDVEGRNVHEVTTSNRSWLGYGHKYVPTTLPLSSQSVRAGGLSLGRAKTLRVPTKRRATCYRAGQVALSFVTVAVVQLPLVCPTCGGPIERGPVRN